MFIIIQIVCMGGGINLYTYNNLFQYKIENGVLVKRSEEELEEERYNRINIPLYSNPNLLINPDFRINQREKTEYIGNIYGVDRWQGTQGSNITVVENGIKTECFDETHNQGVKQFIECDMDLLVGKSFTLSLEVDTTGVPDEFVNVSSKYHWLSINNINHVFMVTKKQSSEILSYSGTIQYLDGVYKPYLLVRLNTLTGTIIKWAKLELGKQATPFISPEKTIELLKCKRYYQKIGVPKGNYDAIIKNITSYTAASAKQYLSFYFDTECEMRTTPKIKLYGIPNSDAGYALAYIDGNSPHITRQWSYGISHSNKKSFIIVAYNESNDKRFDAGIYTYIHLVFYTNSGVELDAEVC